MPMKPTALNFFPTSHCPYQRKKIVSTTFHHPFKRLACPCWSSMRVQPQVELHGKFKKGGGVVVVFYAFLCFNCLENLGNPQICWIHLDKRHVNGFALEIQESAGLQGPSAGLTDCPKGVIPSSNHLLVYLKRNLLYWGYRKFMKL